MARAACRPKRCSPAHLAELAQHGQRRGPAKARQRDVQRGQRAVHCPQHLQQAAELVRHASAGQHQVGAGEQRGTAAGEHLLEGPGRRGVRAHSQRAPCCTRGRDASLRSSLQPLINLQACLQSCHIAAGRGVQRCRTLLPALPASRRPHAGRQGRRRRRAAPPPAPAAQTGVARPSTCRRVGGSPTGRAAECRRTQACCDSQPHDEPERFAQLHVIETCNMRE